MKTVEEIQSDIRQLPQSELLRIREFLDDLVEDTLEFTPEFESQIQDSSARCKAM